MQFLVLGWMVLEVTGSRTQLGWTLFAYGLPNTALLMLGGAIADRMNRKWLLMLTQGAVAGFILALAAVTLAGVLQLWHIYLLAVGLGMLQGLNQPARVALISDVADQRSLLDAVAQSNAAVHLGRIVGPPAAGLLIDFWGLGAALALNGACYIGSVLFLMGVHSARTRPAAAAGGEPFWRNFAATAVYIWQTPVLLTVLALACSFGGLAMSHLQIIPAFAQEQLGSDASGVGAAAAGLRHRGAAGQPGADADGAPLALPLAAGRVGGGVRRPDAVRLVALVLGVVGAVPAAGGGQPGDGVAAGDDAAAAGGAGGDAGQGDGAAALHAGVPLSGGRCRWPTPPGWPAGLWR